MGYKYSTRAAMTVSISDMTVPEKKPVLIKQAQDTVDLITKNYKRGLITEEERYKEVVETWKETDDELTHELLSGLDKYNNIFMMADSGARGSDKQIKQLAGMRGLMADTTCLLYTSDTIERYVCADFFTVCFWHLQRSFLLFFIKNAIVKCIHKIICIGIILIFRCV